MDLSPGIQYQNLCLAFMIGKIYFAAGYIFFQIKLFRQLKTLQCSLQCLLLPDRRILHPVKQTAVQQSVCQIRQQPVGRCSSLLQSGTQSVIIQFEKPAGLTEFVDIFQKHDRVFCRIWLYRSKNS